MSEPCDCPMSGWCSRHGVEKTTVLHKLCQTRENYRRAWDEGRGPGQDKAAADGRIQAAKPRVLPTDDEKRKAANAWWHEFHSYPPTQRESWIPARAMTWLAKIERSIPQYGCKCVDQWRTAKLSMQPDFSSARSFAEWGFNMHNYVSLNHAKNPILPLAECWALYWNENNSESDC